MSVKTCQGCGRSIEWDVAECPEPTGDHCAGCPPWTCSTCGELDSYGPNGPHCACWISLADLSHADVKAIFAADGTFNVETNGGLTVA